MNKLIPTGNVLDERFTLSALFSFVRAFHFTTLNNRQGAASRNVNWPLSSLTFYYVTMLVVRPVLFLQRLTNYFKFHN